jgi:outer membrane protein assembly factor BamE (lipoprotein component of BamABCDE complex)
LLLHFDEPDGDSVAMPRRMSGSSSRTAVGVLVVAALCVAACGGGSDTPKSCRFDANAWRNPASNAGTPGRLTQRQHLADSLVTCKLLVGKTRDQVRALLGRPSFRPAQTRWYFDVGPDRDIGLDREQLYVQFSGQSRVRKAELVTF